MLCSDSLALLNSLGDHNFNHIVSLHTKSCIRWVSIAIGQDESHSKYSLMEEQSHFTYVSIMIQHKLTSRKETAAHVMEKITT